MTRTQPRSTSFPAAVPKLFFLRGLGAGATTEFMKPGQKALGKISPVTALVMGMSVYSAALLTMHLSMTSFVNPQLRVPCSRRLTLFSLCRRVTDLEVMWMSEREADNRHDPMLAPRYMGIPTFMRTPLIDDPAKFDIALVGIPYDGAVTNRPGARHGPREVRNASSMMRAIHPTFRVNPYELCRVGDGGDVPFTRLYEPESAHKDIERFISRLATAGARIVAVGGDHSITLPVLRGLVSDGPVGLIHVDAHTDTWDEFMGSRYSHGAPFRRAVEEGLIDPHRTIQIGIRGAQNSTRDGTTPTRVGCASCSWMR